MPDKHSFFQSINKETIFDNDFFKKIYGYSICDNTFLKEVAAKLISINREEGLQAYNEWYSSWRDKNNQEIKKVAEWYRREFDTQFEVWMKTERERVAKECKMRKTELLQKKKMLLLMRKSMQSTKS